MALTASIKASCYDLWLRLRRLVTGREARERLGMRMRQDAYAKMKQLMLETDPCLPEKTEARAEAFKKQIMRHFIYLKTEFGFDVRRAGTTEFDMGTLVVILAKGCLEIEFSRFREEFAIVVSAIGGSKLSAEHFLPRDRFGFGGCHIDNTQADLFAPMLSDAERGDRRLAKWADVLYPFWPRLFKEAAIQPKEKVQDFDDIVAEERRRNKITRAADAAYLKTVRLEEKKAATTKAGAYFQPSVHEIFSFMETLYNFRLTMSAEKPYLVRYERVVPLGEAESGVRGITIEYGSQYSATDFQLYLVIEVYVSSFSRQLTRLFWLPDLLKERQVVLQPEELVAKTRDRMVQVLTLMAALFRKHCDELMRGNLDIVARAYARPALMAKECAVDWARKEAQRAAGDKDWKEVVRLLRWIGERRTANETALFNYAMKVAGEQPLRLRLRED